jgi:hypothetical protein
VGGSELKLTGQIVFWFAITYALQEAHIKLYGKSKKKNTFHTKYYRTYNIALIRFCTIYLD